MRSVIICLLSLLLVPALSALAGNQGLPSLSSHPPSTLNRPSTRLPSNRLPSVNQLATYEPRIHLAPIHPPSTHPPSTPLPSVHQLPIHQPSHPLTHQPSTHPPSIHQPPTRQPPTHPRPPLPLPHGHIVVFQTNNGPHPGVILGSHRDRQGKFTVAPTRLFRNDQTQRPELHFPDMVVKVHPNDMLSSRVRLPDTASTIMRHHAQHPPIQADITAPLPGSRNYVALGDHR